MDLFSLVRSSAWEIVFSKRSVVAIYCIAGLLVIVDAFSTSLQFYDAYVHLHQFDVKPSDFVDITLWLFLPLWLVGALMLRACVQRLRLAIWARRSFKIAEYQTPLSPAEAGFIVDSEFNHRELVATLVDLHFRGLIALSINGVNVTVQVLRDGSQPVRGYERQLLAMLANTNRSYVSFRDPTLVMHSEQLQDMLIGELEARRYLRREHLPNGVLKVVFRILYIIAGFVGAVEVFSYITDYHEAMTIDYPRYAVTLTEPIVLGIVLFVMVGVVASGFRPRFSHKGTVYSAWSEAAGYLLYLRTVYVNRLDSQYLASQDVSTLRAVSPFTVAFGITPDDPQTIADLLNAGMGQS